MKSPPPPTFIDGCDDDDDVAARVVVVGVVVILLTIAAAKEAKCHRNGLTLSGKTSQDYSHSLVLPSPAFMFVFVPTSQQIKFIFITQNYCLKIGRKQALINQKG